MDPSVTYSVVIPVYNSTSSLPELVHRIHQVFLSDVKDTYEIILVDDGSTNDETWKQIEFLVKEYSQVRAYQLMRNFGKNAALLCGMESSKGNYVIMLDDDLQHQPEDIPTFLAQKEHDVVIGAFLNKECSLVKKVTSEINGWFEVQLLGKPRLIKSSPFRMVTKQVVQAMLAMKTSYPSIPAMMYSVTRDVVNVRVTHSARVHGESGYTMVKMGATLSNMIINNSSLLLRIVAGAGMIIALLSLSMAFFFVSKKILKGTLVPGWASLMVAILFLGGLTLLSIGILGEYLVRIINGVERKPSYVVRKKTAENSENESSNETRREMIT